MDAKKKVIKHYLSGDDIDVTNKPEEVVRQNFLKVLHKEYGYPKEHMAVEVPIYSGGSEVADVVTGKPKRADIVIYKTEHQKYDEIYLIIECKQEKVNDGEFQAKSYGNNTTASIVVWHNGIDTLIWERKKPTQYGYQKRLYIPRFGEYYGSKKVLKSELKPAVDLQLKFKKIHNNIYANTKSSDKTWVFNQMLYLLFIKMYDEKLFDDECKFYLGDTEEEEILNLGSSKSFKKRIWDLFAEVKTSAGFSDVFSGREEIELDVEQVAYIVSEIEYLNILYTDVKGEAFQAFINNYFRGDAGQFFTPDPVKKMIVEILAPEPTRHIVFDPACGSAGFLVSTISYFRNLIKTREGFVDSSGDVIADSDLSNKEKKLLAGEIKAIAGRNILGMDFDDNLTKIAKMYMIMVDDGHAGIFTSNALIKLDELKKITGRVHKECCDIIMTNPPFGSKGKVNRKDILENFELGYKWKKEKDTGKYSLAEKVEKNLIGGKKKGDGQIPDVLFLERCYEFLKPGGRMAIVLPDGDLSNLSLSYVRQWLSEHMAVVGVISLPPHTFVPFGAGPKSSVLICVKPNCGDAVPDKYPIFFAKLHKIGYDVRGKVMYKRDVNGLIVDNDGNSVDDDRDDEYIAQNGKIDTDIPELVSKWNDFRMKNKSFLW
jgi:type I restriction enzyme M protein